MAMKYRVSNKKPPKGWNVPKHWVWWNGGYYSSSPLALFWGSATGQAILQSRKEKEQREIDDPGCI